MLTAIEEDRHDLIVEPGKSASFTANQTAIYECKQDGKRIAMVKGQSLTLMIPGPPDYDADDYHFLGEIIPENHN
jgi:hypothetical protein